MTDQEYLPVQAPDTLMVSNASAALPIDDAYIADRAWSGVTGPDPLLGDSSHSGTEDWLAFDNMQSLWTQWPFAQSDELDASGSSSVRITSPKPSTDLRHSWFTHLNDTSNQSNTASPLPRSRQVDDEYRQSLQQKLHIQLGEHLLPSAEYLNICFKAYFKKFNPVFPVIHGPTFCPSRHNAILMLSICSIGSLLTGHPLALNRGLNLAERLHKAILNNWTSIMRRRDDEALSLVQAALLGQTFCLVAGQAEHIAQFDAFHGTVVSWARRLNTFQAHHKNNDNIGNDEASWKKWARVEEEVRLGLALRIHDAEISSILYHGPSLSSNYAVAGASSDQLFQATSLRDWLTLRPQFQVLALRTPPDLRQSPGRYWSPAPFPPPGHSFDHYASLEDTLCCILQARSDDSLGEDTVNNISSHLDQIYETLSNLHNGGPLRSANILLWHYLHIVLHSDMDLLEEAIGRNGLEINDNQIVNIQRWITSEAAQRAVVHASLIRDWMDGIHERGFSHEPAIHVPRIVFAAAVVLFCYHKYHQSSTYLLITSREFEKFSISPVTVLDQVKKCTTSEILCSLADALPRTGHWPVSRTLAGILDLLILSEAG